MSSTGGPAEGFDRRRFLQALGATGAGLALGGCSKDDSKASGGTATYWVQPNASQQQMQSFLKDLATGFQATSKQYTAKTLVVPWEDSQTKLTAAFSSGNPPDVTYQIAPWMNIWRETGVLADFHKIAPKQDVDKFLDGVNSSLLDAAKGPKGELLAIPYVTGGSHHLTVNVNIWEKAGKPPLPTTYDEMIPFAKALTMDVAGRRLGEPGFDAKHVASYGMNWPPVPAIEDNYLWHYFWSFGSDYVSADGKDIGFDNDSGRAALQNMKAMVDSGAATPPGLYTDENKWGNAIFAGKAGMQWVGGFTADQAKAFPKARVRVLDPPKGPGGQQLIVGACGYIAVAAKSKHPEAAYALAKYILSPEPQEKYTRLILALPVHPTSGPFYTDLPDPRMDDFQNAVAKLGKYTRITRILKYQPQEYLMGKINDYLAGKQDLDAMIKDASKQVRQMAAAAS
ncbi:MAG TPA: substrate-binding domain-containing protein [Kribbella sp.]